MTGRVNTKFVVALLVAMVLLTGGSIFAWRKLVQTDPAELIARGDVAMKQNNIPLALEQYRRALERRSSDPAIIRRYIDAVSMMPTPNITDARTYIEQMAMWMTNAVSLSPGDAAALDRLARFHYRLATEMNSTSSFDEIRTRCNQALERKADMLVALRWRGIAQTNRMRLLDLPDAERAATEKDLLAALEADPNDLEAEQHLVQWYLLEARHLDRAATTAARAKELFAKGVDQSQKMLARDPADPRRMVNHLRTLATVRDTSAATEMMNNLEKQLLLKPEPADVVATTADMLVGTDFRYLEREGASGTMTRGMARSETLLRAAVAQHADDPELNFRLGRILSQQRNYDQAIYYFGHIRGLNPPNSPIDSLDLFQLQLGALFEQGNVMLNKADLAADPAERTAIMAQVEKIITELDSASRNSAQVNFLQGKLAMVREQWALATVKLDLANEQYKEQFPDALMLSAKARSRQGDEGAAAVRLEQLLKINPRLIVPHYELARINLKLRKYDTAWKHIKTVLDEFNPQDATALQLMAALLAQTGRIDEAINVYKQLDPAKHPELSLPLATLYMNAKKNDEAHKLLDPLYRAKPGDTRTLQLLLRVTTDPAQAAQYLALAKQAGVEDSLLKVIASVQSGDAADASQAMEEMVGQETDPLQRALGLYRLYQRSNKPDLAAQELAKATAINRDHPAVIEAQFQTALTARAWGEANALAARAATLNMDLAQGLFYYGQLAMAQGQYDNAATSFRRAVVMRPVFSDGWNQLGDAQRLMGDLGEAVTSYRRAIDQRPNNLRALNNLASVLIAREDFREALDALRAAADFASGDREIVERYLVFEERYGDPSKALAARQKYAEQNPADLGARRALAASLARGQKFAEAQTLVDQLIAAEGKTPANLSVAALILAVQGQRDQALKLLEDHVASRGDKVIAEEYMLLASYQRTFGDNEAAIASLRKAIAIEDPKLHPASRVLADFFFDTGRYADAVGLYQTIWSSNEPDRPVGQRLAEALMRSGDPKQAQDLLAQLVAKFGQDVNSSLLAGIIATVRNEYDQAMTHFNRAVELAPNRAIVYFHRAELYASRPGGDAAAITDLGRALDLDAKAPQPRFLLAQLYLRRAETRDAVRELQTLVRATPEFVRARSLLAQILLDLRDFDALRPFLNESARMFPRDPQWPRFQARLASRAGELDKVVSFLEQAMKIAPTRDTLGDLVNALIDAKRPADGLASLDANDAVVQESSILLAVRGRALVALNRPDDAQIAFSKAVAAINSYNTAGIAGSLAANAIGLDKTLALMQEQAQGDKASMLGLTMAGLELSHGRTQQAADRLQKLQDVVKPGSKDHAIRENFLSVAYHKLGQYDRAREAYEKLLQLEPGNVSAMNNLAYIFADKLNRPQDALAMARKAEAITPYDAEIVDTLGWAQFRAGQVSEALATLQRSIQIRKIPANLYHLAEALLSKGEVTKARELLTEAQALAVQLNDQDIAKSAQQRLEEISKRN